ncbi:hypothetical protein [Bacillus cereus]|uniref:Group-specific protein n=1 Tax=Bacillus cereus TaxID=1396 RepID=A0AAW5L614_BACCE|nr:hypothetical protein [Bacillus cereus]MCQ6288642.1 hypothetical protein [Bacillus cereus]MCQ6317952.1 hypothetical protein [Bacillus cereus]MCQ6329758.1 hypothetical protein [Bacillus cereus]MCQ6385746.1 hypothetical protein [Bacillus cereus]
MMKQEQLEEYIEVQDRKETVYRIYHKLSLKHDEEAIYVSAHHSEMIVRKLLQHIEEIVLTMKSTRVKDNWLIGAPLENILCKYFRFTSHARRWDQEYVEIEMHHNWEGVYLKHIHEPSWFHLRNFKKIIEQEMLVEQEQNEKFLEKIKELMAIPYGDETLVEGELKNYNLHELKRLHDYIQITFKNLKNSLGKVCIEEWNADPANFFTEYDTGGWAEIEQ